MFFGLATIRGKNSIEYLNIQTYLSFVSFSKLGNLSPLNPETQSGSVEQHSLLKVWPKNLYRLSKTILKSVFWRLNVHQTIFIFQPNVFRTVDLITGCTAEYSHSFRTSSRRFLCYALRFWPTVLLVAPLAQCVVCLSSVCDVLYCGETVRIS